MFLMLRTQLAEAASLATHVIALSTATKMKIGTKFTRDGKRYEFLGFERASHIRVRDLSSGRIARILTLEAAKELQQKNAEKEKERQRKIEAKKEDEQRIRDEVDQLTENVEALRKLRDDCSVERSR